MTQLNNIPVEGPMRAGGRATEAGMSFQADVGTWFAVHILARMPIGGRFGIDNHAVPTEIRLETGMTLDDIEVSLSSGGALHVQSKTTATLATGAKAPLAKTGRQLVQWIADSKAAGGVPDLTKSAGVLAIRTDAARSLDALESACRALDLGGGFATTRKQRNVAERTALGAFETIVTAAWFAEAGVAPSDTDLADLARSFHISRFAMHEGEHDWREASQMLGRLLFGGDTAGDGPLRDLKNILRGLIASGAPADREGLLRALRLRGHRDVGAPRFQDDIDRLRVATEAELARLAIHGQLPLAGGLTITRASDRPLFDAVRTGSLLVTGEPGSGKTGALVHLTNAVAAEGAFVTFLSVDRFPGVAIAADLASELCLTHGLAETLAAVPGPGPKFLIIDALDAARGGPAEAVFAALIEKMRADLAEDWTVVASIRRFDLINGRRLRQAFAGSPPDADFSDGPLAAVRHFSVPRLSKADLDLAGAAAPALGGLLTSAPPRLAELLQNVFNLSLAAQLLADGAEPTAFGGIRTQANLIDAYEDVRLPTTPRKQAAAATVAVMAERRRLAVRKVAIVHPEVDAVIQAGVLTEAGDLVSFAHHVLFDHVAGRFHLAWDDPDALVAQLAGDTSVALMLAPALRFAVERIWRADSSGRPVSWQLIVGVFSATSIDVVLGNVALRTAVENVETIADIGDVTSRIAADPEHPALGTMFGRLAQFVAMDIGAAGRVGPEQAIAWAGLAEALVLTGRIPLVDAARILLHALFDHDDLTEPRLLATFGRASRALLELAWSRSPPLMSVSGSAIRFVGKGFASDAAASRELLRRALREPHFSNYADREAVWLAEQVLSIAVTDPAFAAEIYACLYGQAITDDATSALGGQRSRILPLSSNRRQDYEHSRWQLGTLLGRFLAMSPEHGTRAVIDAVIGRAATRGRSAVDQPDLLELGTATIELRLQVVEFGEWDKDDGPLNRDDDPLQNYTQFLRSCDVDGFAQSVAAASRGYAVASVWSRILGVGSKRIREVGDLLWPLMERPALLENRHTLRDAARFAAAMFAILPAARREGFERMLLAEPPKVDEWAVRRWRHAVGRVLALVPEELFTLDRTLELRRQLVAEDLLQARETTWSRSIQAGNYPDYEREQLRREGVDIDADLNRAVLDASKALQERLQEISEASPAAPLAGLWSEAVALLILVDANPGLPEPLSRSAWTYIANALAHVVSSATYVPEADGLPTLAAVFAALESLWSNSRPQAHGEKLGIGWDGWSIRIHVAKAWVSLAPRFAVEHGAIVSHIESIFGDPNPDVRAQVARNLQVINLAAPERMWAMGERIAAVEADEGVIVSYLNRSLRRFSHLESERCERILATVRGRLGEFARNEGERDRIQEALGSWIAQLFVCQGRPLLGKWLRECAADPERYGGLLNSYSSSLRETFFGRYAAAADDAGRKRCDRAQEGLDVILSQAIKLSSKAHAILFSEAGEQEKVEANHGYGAAERVIYHAMNQLYFGSGAYADARNVVLGLTDNGAKASFLNDYTAILAVLQQSREPATLHHLIELYDFLMPGKPVAVFKAIHEILLGRGAQEGYQFESLGISVVVKVVKRYIADHRVVFDDVRHREMMVEVLQLFSDVGWPEALKLLYDLPDLLR